MGQLYVHHLQTPDGTLAAFGGSNAAIATCLVLASNQPKVPQLIGY